MGSIIVQNLGKAYKQYPTRWSRLAEWLSPSKRARHSLKWVMQDVSFSIKPGESVGIIGINGAGKSTLLKMITGTTRPTTGHVVMSGRVAALLELGMGFHADFTGRQNALMAGQLLGYSVEEITDLMPEIEAFAEIGEYIDQPVRVYSSGMQVRLAFSVATAIRPDILIVDEALSVGDAYFQHKSFDRIRDFRSKGTTLLIVSHDKSAIQAICDRAILLSDGRLASEGNPETVLDLYNAMLADKQNQNIVQEVGGDGKVSTISGTGEAEIISVVLGDENQNKLDIVKVGQRVVLKIRVLSTAFLKELVVGYIIKDHYGQFIYGTNTHYHNQVSSNIPPNQIIEIKFTFDANLGPGTYSISLALHSGENHLLNNYAWQDRAVIFNVVNIDKNNFVGSSWIPPKINLKVENEF